MFEWHNKILNIQQAQDKEFVLNLIKLITIDKLEVVVTTIIEHVATPLWGKWEDETHTPKLGLGSPPGLPKLQSSVVGVKTSRIGMFFISLERYWSVDVKMALHGPFGHLQHKLWPKEGPGVKLAVWLPTAKSQESTWPKCVQVECNTPLESSQGELQLCFKPHPNRRSEQRVMVTQSPRSPNWDSFGTPPWVSRDKSHSDVGAAERRIVYYMGEGGDFPRVRAVVCQVSPELPVTCPSTKGVLECELINLLVGLMQVRVNE
jgi:hypothetical protein